MPKSRNLTLMITFEKNKAIKTSKDVLDQMFSIKDEELLVTFDNRLLKLKTHTYYLDNITFILVFEEI